MWGIGLRPEVVGEFAILADEGVESGGEIGQLLDGVEAGGLGDTGGG